MGTHNLYAWLLGKNVAAVYNEKVEWREWKHAFILAEQQVPYRGEIVKLKDLFAVLSPEGIAQELKTNKDLRKKLKWKFGTTKSN